MRSELLQCFAQVCGPKGQVEGSCIHGQRMQPPNGAEEGEVAIRQHVTCPRQCGRHRLRRDGFADEGGREGPDAGQACQGRREDTLS